MCWHFHSLKDQVLKIELTQLVWLVQIKMKSMVEFSLPNHFCQGYPLSKYERWLESHRDDVWIWSKSGGAMVLRAVSGGTRGKVMSLVASRGKCVWQCSPWCTWRKWVWQPAIERAWRHGRQYPVPGILTQQLRVWRKVYLCWCMLVDCFIVEGYCLRRLVRVFWFNRNECECDKDFYS